MTEDAYNFRSRGIMKRISIVLGLVELLVIYTDLPKYLFRGKNLVTGCGEDFKVPGKRGQVWNMCEASECLRHGIESVKYLGGDVFLGPRR